MTLIVGWLDNEVVMMAGDSLFTHGSTRVERANCPKVWKTRICGRSALVGVCGTASALQWLHHTFRWPQTKTRNLVADVTSALQTLRDQLNLEDVELDILLGFRGRLLRIHNLADVEEASDHTMPRPCAAIGDASDLALGFLAAKTQMWARQLECEDVEESFEMAGRMTTNVGGPLTIRYLM